MPPEPTAAPPSPPPMIITATIPNADEELYERTHTALAEAGIDPFFICLQTREQYAANPGAGGGW